MTKPKKGPPRNFSPAQNRALRGSLESLEARYGSQAKLAEVLGIKQQNVSRLLNDRRSGFSFSTASQVARLCGFAGVDAFFDAAGIGAGAIDEAHVRAAS